MQICSYVFEKKARKIDEVKQMEFVKNMVKKVLHVNTVSAFYIPFIFIVIFFLMKLEKGILIGSVIACIYFAIRLIYRGKCIKYGQMIELKKLDFTEDQVVQGDNLGDVAAIILYLIFGVSEMPSANAYVEGWTGVLLIYCFVYFATAAFSIKKDWVIFKIATLLMSTIQGVMCLVILLGYACIVVMTIFDGRNVEVMFQVNTRYVVESLIVGSAYSFETFPIYTLVPIVVSALLYVIYILFTPIYQLDKMKIAYNIVNILVTLIGVFAFFISKYYGGIIEKNKVAFMNSDVGVDMISNIPTLVDYLDKFDESNIYNLFYLLILPYTFSILVASMCIEMKERKAVQMRKDILERIDVYETNDEEKILELKKEYLYWGGDLLECDAYIQFCKVYKTTEDCHCSEKG